MNSIISFVLLFVINVPLLIKGGIILQWNARRDYIAQNLCVKRNIENNDCNGQCHLKKQLDKLEDTSTENQAQIPIKLKLTESEGLPIILTDFSNPGSTKDTNKFTSTGISLYRFLHIKNNDRPPQHLV